MLKKCPAWCATVEAQSPQGGNQIMVVLPEDSTWNDALAAVMEAAKQMGTTIVGGPIPGGHVWVVEAPRKGGE